MLSNVARNKIGEKRKMKSISWLGVVIAVVAMLAMAMPVFTTSKTRDVASVGDVKLQSTQQFTHVVPIVLSASLLAFGLALIGAGVYTKRAA
jgi:C4-dicarboxylate transporter